MNPNTEYGDDAYEQLKMEPGVPDEMVEAYAEEPAPAVGFNQEFAAEFMPLLFATVLAMAVVETMLKPLLKQGLKAWKGADRDKSGDPPLIRMLAFLAGCGTSVTFGFREMVYDLTGSPISMLEATVYGGASVAVCALVAYMLIEELRPVKATKVIIRGIYTKAFNMLVGRAMTDDEKAELDKTTKHPPVDPHAVTPHHNED